MPRLRPSRVAALVFVLLLLATPAAVLSDPEHTPTTAPDPQRFKPFVTLAELGPEGPGFLTAWLEERAAVRNRPGGKVVARLGLKTEWGTARILSVVEQRGNWLGVSTQERPNGKLGWIPARVARLSRVTDKLVADLSRRRLTMYRDGRAIRHMRVAIGRPANPTPTGRFAITDLLLVTKPGPYGCCVIALSGRQPDVPPDWPGGNRLAIHHTQNEGTIGQRASLGCLRASGDDMRWLLRQRLQPGTPVFIHR